MPPDRKSASEGYSEAAVSRLISGAYILTVDDYSAIRRIIINTLRVKEAYVDEAANGAVALDKMRLAVENNAPYDLVFLDIEMPVMDGVTLLRHMRADKDLRDTPAIVFSSHSESDDLAECAKLGISDYIIKPATKHRIYEAAFRSLKDRPRDTAANRPPRAESGASQEQAEKEYAKILFKKLESIENLPALPMVLERIRALTGDLNANSERIANIMKDEPALMTNVLKVANSALYGTRERIDSLQTAITRLGLNAVHNLATSMAVIAVISKGASEGFNHKEFCKHSISTGIAMGVLYSMCKAKVNGRFSNEALHLTGLLHDIGKMIINQFFHDEFTKAGALSVQHSVPLFLAEQKMLGVHHADVGAWLARKWNLSDPFVQTIRYHHDPMLAGPEHAELVTLCHCANYVCNLDKIGDAGDTLTPFFDQRAFDRIGLVADQIPEIVARVRAEAKNSEILVSLL